MKTLINKLKLIPIKRAFVHTSTQKKYNELMRVYELGGWKWFNEDLPTTKESTWDDYKEETCVNAGYDFIHNKGKNYFGYDFKTHYTLKGIFKVISTQEFYEKQKITLDMLKEINKYFEERK